MEKLTSFVQLCQNVKKRCNSSDSISLILIGGCSRTGKTTLAENIKRELTKDNIHSLVVHSDHWIVSLEKRQPDSKVLERFECAEIEKAITLLLNKNKIFPPVYDPISRKRISENSNHYFYLENGVLIVEGVIVLALKNLFEKSSYNIYIEINDEKRTQRLYDFYRNIKKLSEKQTLSIISSRENEEVLFIKELSKNADCIYYS